MLYQLSYLADSGAMLATQRARGQSAARTRGQPALPGGRATYADLTVSGDWDQAGPALGEAPWRRLAAAGDWRDLVLDPGLRARLAELPETYRSRVAADAAARPHLVLVFGGSSGSGKTATAQALAAELGLALVQVDAGALSAAEPDSAADLGERLLREAEQLGAVLAIDHADELLRHPDGLAALTLRANPGTWPEVVVLCAEVTRGLTHAAGLAIDATLVFPELDSRAREEIWRRHLPHDHAVPPGAMAYLAQAFRLSGAAIAGCCESALRRADDDGDRVSLRHVAGALDEAYRGRLTSDRTRAGLAEVRARAARSESEPGAQPGATVTSNRRLRLSSRRDPAAPGSTPHGSLAIWIVLAAIVFIGALIGLVAATRTSSPHRAPAAAAHPAAQRQVSAGPLWLSIPSGWRVSRTAMVAGATISPGLTLSPASSPNDRLVIGLTGPSAPGVPTRFRAGHPGSPQPVMLGAQLLYRLPAPSASGTTLYALPSLRATVIAACEPQSPPFSAQCTQVLSTLTVSPGALLPTAVQTAYVRRLDGLLGTLTATRTRLRPQLRRAASAALRARLAARLAAAHLTAGFSVGRLAPGPAGTPNRRLAAALLAAGVAYARLSMVPARSPRALRRAEDRVTSANAALARAEAALTALGYPLA